MCLSYSTVSSCPCDGCVTCLRCTLVLYKSNLLTSSPLTLRAGDEHQLLVDPERTSSKEHEWMDRWMLRFNMEQIIEIFRTLLFLPSSLLSPTRKADNVCEFLSARYKLEDGFNETQLLDILYTYTIINYLIQYNLYYNLNL